MLHNNERGQFPSVFSEGDRVQFQLQLSSFTVSMCIQWPKSLTGLVRDSEGSTRRPLTCFSPPVVLRAFPSSRKDL